MSVGLLIVALSCISLLASGSLVTREEPSMWENEEFITHVLLDSSFGAFEDSLIAGAIQEKFTDSMVDSILSRVPELYFVRCKSVLPEVALDLFQESSVELKASLYVDEFVNRLDSKHLFRCFLMPPGQLRSSMINRIHSMHLTDPRPIFECIDNLPYTYNPFLKTLSADTVPLVDSIMSRMSEDDLSMLMEEWDTTCKGMSEIERFTRFIHSVDFSTKLRLFPSLIFNTFYHMRQAHGQDTLIVLWAISATFSSVGLGSPNHSSFFFALYQTNSRYLARLLELMIMRNPLLFLNWTGWIKVLKNDDPLVGSILDLTLFGLHINYLTLIFHNTNFNQMIHTVLDLLPAKYKSSKIAFLVSSNQAQTFEEPKLGYLSFDIFGVPAEIVSTKFELPQTLCRETYSSPYTQSLCNLLFFCEMLGIRDGGQFAAALLNVHPFLSDSDLAYLRLYLKKFPSSVNTHIETITPLLQVQDISNLFGSNSTDDGPLIPPSLVSRNAYRLNMLCSLVFGTGPFAYAENGLKKLLMAISRVRFKVTMVDLEYVKWRVGQHCNVEILFCCNEIPKEWLLVHYGCLGIPSSNARSLNRLFESDTVFKTLCKWLQVFKTKSHFDRLSHSIKCRIAEMVNYSVEHYKEQSVLLLNALSLTVDQYKDARQLEKELEISSKPHWFVYFVNERRFPDLIEKHFETIFPFLSFKEKLAYLINYTADRPVANSMIIVIMNNFDSGPNWLINKLIDHFERDPNNRFVFKLIADLHSKWSPSASYHAGKNITRVFRIISSFERSGNTFPSDLVENYRPFFLSKAGMYSTDDLPNCFFEALIGSGAFKPDRSNTVLSVYLPILASLLNSSKKAIELICHRTGQEHRQVLERTILKNPPTSMRSYWTFIKERARYASDNKSGFMFVRIHVGERTIRLAVPVSSTMADLYNILNSSFSLSCGKMTAIVSVDTLRVYLPTNEGIKYFAKLEFRVVYCTEETLPLVAQVAHFIGLNLSI